MRIALIACCKGKRAGVHPARTLYTGDLFAKSLEWAEANTDHQHILSAAHGLLELDTHIPEYNCTLAQLDTHDRHVWACRVMERLHPLIRQGDEVVFLAGRLYRDPLIQHLRDRKGVSWSIPMEGKGIGEQKQWLKRENATTRTATAILSRLEG